MSPASGIPPTSPEPEMGGSSASPQIQPVTDPSVPHAAWASHEGYKRSANEDRGAVFECALGRVLIVCDGMGGHEGGEKAAEITMDAFRRLLMEADGAASVEETLRSCLHTANAEILAWRKTRPALRNMGSTVVIAVIQKAALHIAHVGDSRAYMARGANLVRLTRDQTLVQDFIERGHITEDEARTHPFGNALKQAVGQDNEPVLEVSRPFSLMGGDLVFLCSDGLSGYVKDAALQRVLSTGLADPSKIAEAFVALALATGGQDNVTVALTRVEGLPAPKADETQKFNIPSGKLRIPVPATVTAVFSSPSQPATIDTTATPATPNVPSATAGPSTNSKPAATAPATTPSSVPEPIDPVASRDLSANFRLSEPVRRAAWLIVGAALGYVILAMVGALPNPFN